MKTVKSLCSVALFALTSLSLTLGSMPVAQAGAKGGPKKSTTNVNAYTSDVYHMSFNGSSKAEVAISGDGDTELDLYIYDENNHLVASDTTGYGDDRSVTWMPRWTGSFTIKVVNRGDVYNHYTIATN